MKNKIKNAISRALSNKKGSGEIVVILLLMVLGMFFLTKFVFDIPFPFTQGKEVQNEQVEDTDNKGK